MVSLLLSWTPRCCHGLLIADMVSLLLSWSPCCCHGLLVAVMVSLLLSWSPCCCHGLLVAAMVSLLLPWSPRRCHGLPAAAMVSSLLSKLPAGVKGLPAVTGTSSLQSGSPCRRIVIHAAAIPSAPSFRGRPHPRLSTAAVRHERTVHIRLFLLFNSPRTLLSVRILLIDRCVPLRATGSHHHT